jgi:A/G-specific adenine glycosylase
MDGNVKRVLTRVLGFSADLASSANERKLWDLATELVPAHEADMPAYTQGLMDLGATVCLPRSPSCLVCPLEDVCVARREGRPESYPVRTRKLKRSAQSLWLLWAQTREGQVWLLKRPPKGVWASLYCLPVFDSREALEDVVPARYRNALNDAPAFLHVLTHKDLHLHPVCVTLPAHARACSEGDWIAADAWPPLGLPSPIRKLLESSGAFRA